MATYSVVVDEQKLVLCVYMKQHDNIGPTLLNCQPQRRKNVISNRRPGSISIAGPNHFQICDYSVFNCHHIGTQRNVLHVFLTQINVFLNIHRTH